MCLSPIIRKNPNKGLKHQAGSRDIDSSYIAVPCGNCPECRSIRQLDFLQRCELASLDHDVYFGTLTYKESSIPKTPVYYHLDGSRRNYKYADVRDFRLMMKRVRKDYFNSSVDVKYLCVTEYGGEKHRMHFHFLFFVPKKIFTYKDHQGYTQMYNPANKFNTINFQQIFWTIFLFEWRRNVSKSTKKPIWQSLCDYIVDSKGRSTYDFHYVEPLTKSGKRTSAVCIYVTKYILKFDNWYNDFRHALYNNLSPDDYKEVLRCVRPRVLVSLYLGVGSRTKVDFKGGYYRIWCTDKESYKDYYCPPKKYSLVKNNLYSDHVSKGIKDSCNGITHKDYACFYDTETGRLSPLSKYLCKYNLIKEDFDTLKTNEAIHKYGDAFAPIIYYSKEFEEYLNNNPDYKEKQLSKYAKRYLYLEECNNSDMLLYVDYGKVSTDFG